MKRMTTTICTNCQAQISVEVYQNINVIVQKNVEAQILEDTLQSATCECGQIVQLEPHFIYLTNNMCIAAMPSKEIGEYRTHSQEVEASMAQALAALGPEAGKLTKRLIFGWPALKEKILANKYGISDVDLELVKLALIRESGQLIIETCSLRLIEVSPNELVFDSIEFAEPHDIVSTFSFGSSILQDIRENPEDWAELREAIDQGVFVDVFTTLY